ncbi:unknown [Eubacterium sp. CAG:192]|nr:unknown [Eubacterium sp. CAG:192]
MCKRQQYDNRIQRLRAKKKDNHCSGCPCDKSRGGRCDKKRELAVATV